MIDKIEDIKSDVSAYKIPDAETLEQFRLKFLSRKGLINDYLKISKMLTGRRRA